MADLYEYAVAVHLYKPIKKRAVQDFAVGADWTPVAGDVKISINGGAAANVTNLPTAITMGNTAMWDFSLTAGELTGKKIRITVADAATKAVEDAMFELDTYGNASAQHKVNLNDSVRAGLTALPNADAETAGGLYTKGAGVGQIAQTTNGTIDINVVRVNNDATAAANLAKTTRAIGRGTVTAGASLTAIPTSAFTPAGAVTDQFKGKVITFDADTTTVALRGQSCTITTTTNASNPTFTVVTGELQTIPVSGDTFSVT